jgi:hypothetical protein
MSAAIQRHAIDLLWRQWTAAGVAGIAKPPQQAIDLEALIAFTPYVAAADPRLSDESTDWCVRVGKSFISISRLRQVSRLMPPRSQDAVPDLPASLIAKLDISEQRLSKKSRAPSLELPCLVQLRSRYIFGVGARADILSRLVMRERTAGAQRAAAIRPAGYTKQAVATVLDELSQAGVLKRFVRKRSVSYEVAKDAPLRSLLAPLPKRMPSWAERFVIVANILETWRRFGTRATYAIELAKVLDGIRPVIAAAGEQAPSTGRPRELLARIERWALTLLDDNVWEDSWMFEEQDISHEILDALHDRIVETVHSGEYPVGYTELEELTFRNIDSKKGTSEFTVQFTAEHPKEEFSFDGYVEGTFRFDPDAEDKEEFLDSLKVTEANEHFDMGAPDE